MGESAYRGAETSLHATLAELSQRAGELAARVDRNYLVRFDPERLARLHEKWQAAESAARDAFREDASVEALALACDAHRAVIVELEDAVATGVDEARVAQFVDLEQRARVHNRILVGLGLLVLAGLAALFAVVSWLASHQFGDR
jgi:hypothetical protein